MNEILTLENTNEMKTSKLNFQSLDATRESQFQKWFKNIWHFSSRYESRLMFFASVIKYASEGKTDLFETFASHHTVSQLQSRLSSLDDIITGHV